MKKANPAHPWTRCALAGAACMLAVSAQAQLRVPSIGVPTLPRAPLAPVQQSLQQAAPLQDLRATTTRELIRRYPQAIEVDPVGEPIRRAELLWLSPSPSAVDAARAQGFTVLREENLAELDLRQFVMRPPAGMTTAQAGERLRVLDPQATVDFNHLYTRSGDVTRSTIATSSMPAGNGSAARVGLIDGGIARAHPALRHALVIGWGCGGKEVASDHGTAVASLLVGRDGEFRGVRPGATLYAADVYCDLPAGGAAEDVARALAWMVRERVPVINISLVGPANRLVERATIAVIRQGHIVVAAVGNDGPAAPPLYPASYPGVIGVTGVTPARRVLPEAAQGPQVMFAAPGSQLVIAQSASGYGTARGTSFAAPLVAGVLAEALHEPDREAAAAAIAQLAATAVDLGDPGRDVIYGFGLVGEHAVTPAPGRNR